MKPVTLALLCITVVGAATAPAADWTQLQNGPQRRGHTPEQIDAPFRLKWTWNRDQSTAVRISYFVQPIVADGRVFIGACDNRMYALDAASGRQLWAFQTEGVIMGTAAYGPDTRLVYFGSHDSHVYAVDAADGTLAWKFKTGEGVWAAILYVDGTVYVGSRDGYFYALDGRTGKPVWQYPAADEEPLPPIYSPASFSPKTGLVYFGARDVRIYAVDAKSGRLAARSEQLNGADFGWYWPVVLDEQGWIMVRTCNYHTHKVWVGPYRGEGRAIAAWIDENPQHRFFHTLDARTLKPAYTAPILFQGGCYGRPAPPIVDDKGNVYAIKNNTGYMGGCTLVQLDLKTSEFARQFTSGGGGAYRIVGDEGSALSMAGTKIVVSNPQSLGMEDVTTSRSIPVIRESSRNRDGYTNRASLWIFDISESLLFSSEEKEPGVDVWHCSPDWTPAAIAGKTIYWLSDGRALAAIGAGE